MAPTNTPMPPRAARWLPKLCRKNCKFDRIYRVSVPHPSIIQGQRTLAVTSEVSLQAILENPPKGDRSGGGVHVVVWAKKQLHGGSSPRPVKPLKNTATCFCFAELVAQSF